MSWLLDTNVVSELLKPQPAPQVLRWMSAQADDTLHVSTITQAEMLLGVQLMAAGRRRQALGEVVAQMFEHDFRGQVLAFDAVAASAYAGIVVARRQIGAPISMADAQIAAIAQARGLAVVTRNVRDFDGCGVAVLNPWEAV